MSKKRNKSGHKVAALLAGGLVLGIGAATTLAAWSDSQHATATFTAGVFSLVSSADGSTWVDHPQGDPAVLAMGTDGMSPGISGFGYLDVKTSSAATLGGTVLLEAATRGTPSDDAMVDALELRAKVIAAGLTCNATALAGATFAPVGIAPGIPTQTIQPAGNSTVRYCLEIRMIGNAPNAAQGKIANLSWKVLGTSS